MKDKICFRCLFLIALFSGCEIYDPPVVLPPIVDDIEINESIDLGFEITADAGYHSSEVSAQKGTAIHKTDIGKGAVQGFVYINYTSASEPGIDYITFTVKDIEGNLTTSKVEINIIESN